MESTPTMIQRGVALGPMTTLEVGGGAEYFADIYDEAALTTVIQWAERKGLPVTLLGGGSNVLIADDGIPGLTIRLSLPGRRVRERAGTVDLTLGAGEDWDHVVKHTVSQDWAGIECLVGIPGRVGSAPIQNIGAYGQELSQSTIKVRVYDLHRHEFSDLSAQDCQFGYRDSRFKGDHAGQEIVTAVTLRLTQGGTPTVAYRELAKQVSPAPSLSEVMTCVQDLRRQKSMLANTPDGNHRSAGSFFVNPILDERSAKSLMERVQAKGIDPSKIPHWPVPTGGVKFAAAWLIEQSGLAKGMSDGPVGLSTNHTLAIVNRGGARATDIERFAQFVRQEVAHHFGVTLVPEPRLLGYSRSPFA